MPNTRSITGIILAGGKSRRFGENKALSMFQGEWLIERLIRSVRQVTDEVLLVTNTPAEYAFLGLPMTGDLKPGCGSLGGIYTGLKTMDTSHGICIACDMPFVSSSFLMYMVDFADGVNDVVVPRSDYGFEPMCAVYSAACVGPIERKLNEGDLKIIRFYDEVKVKIITTDDTELFTRQILFNVNTREDYDEALRLISGNE
ncbi:MAG: molybdenum cofactor guanylyltransferase [Gemmatimonadota bacterium]|nr:molybdenum cofactor guanylyltransferase [Gemmatimonadota bacterium]